MAKRWVPISGGLLALLSVLFSSKSFASAQTQPVVVPTTALPRELDESVRCTFYLSANGTGDGTFYRPARQLPQPLPSGTYCLRGGEYDARTLGRPRGVLRSVDIRAFGCERVVVSGTSTIGEWMSIESGSRNVVIGRIEFVEFRNASTKDGVIVVAGDVEGVLIAENWFKSIGNDFFDHGVYLGGGFDDVTRVRNVIISGNRFFGVAGAGVHSFHRYGARNVDVVGNIFSGGRWGVLVSHEGQSQWRVDDNILIGHTDGSVAFVENADLVQPYAGPMLVRRNIASADGLVGPLRIDKKLADSGAAQMIFEEDGRWWNRKGPTVSSLAGGRIVLSGGLDQLPGLGASTTGQQIDPRLESGPFSLTSIAPDLEGVRALRNGTCVPTVAPSVVARVSGRGRSARMEMTLTNLPSNLGAVEYRWFVNGVPRGTSSQPTFAFAFPRCLKPLGLRVEMSVPGVAPETFEARGQVSGSTCRLTVAAVAPATSATATKAVVAVGGRQL